MEENYNIMRTETFRSESLIALFRRRRIATMQQLKAALGTVVTMTVFRKLGELVTADGGILRSAGGGIEVDPSASRSPSSRQS